MDFSNFSQFLIIEILIYNLTLPTQMSRGFSMDTLRPHEYDIPLDRGGHLEGPHVFSFLIGAFVSEL